LCILFDSLVIQQSPSSTLFPYTTLFRSKIQALSNQYGFTVSFLASARAELANFVPETAVKKFNDYVDEYNVRMSADKRSVLANEIQAFLTANPKLKESPAGKRMDQETKQFIEFINMVVQQMNTIKANLE